MGDNQVVTRNITDDTTRIEVWHCICKYCKHEWVSKKDKVPNQCSKCRKRKWNKTSNI